MAKHRIYTTSFSSVYPAYVAKAEEGPHESRGRSDHHLVDRLQ